MITFFLVVLGLLIGSFLNVVIYRLPRGESIVLPPSHCPSCQHRLGPSDLVPVFSFLFLKGRCRYCQERIGWRYPLVELLCGLLTWVWWVRMGGAEINTDSIAMLIVTYALVAIALIDLDHQIIPNKITLPLLVAGLAFRGIQGELIPAVLGLLAGAGPLGLIAVVYSKGMGWGDVKLLGMLGVFVGWQKIIITMFLGSFLGVVWMVPLILTGKFDRKTPFAFGPFLAAGALLVLYGWDLLTQVFGMLMGF